MRVISNSFCSCCFIEFLTMQIPIFLRRSDFIFFLSQNHSVHLVNESETERSMAMPVQQRCNYYIHDNYVFPTYFYDISTLKMCTICWSGCVCMRSLVSLAWSCFVLPVKQNPDLAMSTTTSSRACAAHHHHGDRRWQNIIY